MNKPKIAIYVEGGIVTGVRSNISSDLEIEIVDQDMIDLMEEQKSDRWEELQTELEFGN